MYILFMLLEHPTPFLQALQAAKIVHIYGRDADDTLEWIQEKDGLVSSENFGHDLETAQALVSKHEVLEVGRLTHSYQLLTTTFNYRILCLYFATRFFYALNFIHSVTKMCHFGNTFT